MSAERLSEDDLPLPPEEFGDRLIAEVDAFIDEHGLDESRFDEQLSEEQMREGLYTRIYNEIMAVDLPRRMLEAVGDEQVFVHLLKQIEDEAKHGRMLAQRVWNLGGTPELTFEKTEQSVKDYWANYEGKSAVEIGTMMQCGSERMAAYRVQKEMEFYDDETAEIYDSVIDPEEQFHAKIGENLLREMCDDRATQREALRASREIREIIMAKHDTGVREAYND